MLLRSADPLCVARNADRSLPSAIRDVRPQNGLRNKMPPAFAKTGSCNPCLFGPARSGALRLFSENAGIVVRRWPKKKQCRCASAR